MARPTPLLQGTLDLLILKALSLQPLHGLGVSRRVEQITKGAYVVRPGSLFPALHRLERQGWLKSEWKLTESNQRAKYYRLTLAGKKQLASEHTRWTELVRAIAGVMNPAGGGRGL